MNKLLIATIIISLTISSVVWSKGGFHTKHHKATNWAKVIKVESIMRTVEHNRPSEVCWTEQLRYDRSSNENNSYSGTIVGGIIGGALGNALGHKKKNKKIGTAIGAVLGATIGHEISTRHRPRHNDWATYRDERHCELRDHITYEEEVVGYHVWYRYFGSEYKTRMTHKPGDKIKVRVSVEPY